LTLLVGWQEGHPACKKLEWWGTGMVICLARGADLHMAQLMPLTVSCFSKIQIGFTFLVLVHPGSLRKKCRFLSSNLYYYRTTTPSVLQAAFQPVSQQENVGIVKKKVADVGTGQMPLPSSNLQYQTVKKTSIPNYQHYQTYIHRRNRYRNENVQLVITQCYSIIARIHSNKFN